MEIRRFGVGHRRPEGPPGTTGVEGQTIHSDTRGYVGELAFRRRSAIEPHSNDSTVWFVVIEGGGWVQVGEERARIAAGEAVLWPTGVVHAAWTDLSEMRAIVVEFPSAAGRAAPAIVEGAGRALTPGAGGAERGEGRLAARPPRREEHDTSEGEPF